jgi:methylmalonyl-CoA carboxyltransferase 12S subunit
VSKPPVDKPAENELVAVIEALRGELRGLVERVAALEQHQAGPPALTAPTARAPVAAEPARPEIPEDDLLVIAAAVAAFLGVRAHVRQVRLIQSAAWAQVGRATVHASHRVH